ncbi:MAG TPA: acetyl-CoA carboxylase biotin carboxylase subunit [Amycolatopsis sp.]|uniref:acetyl-CoA carboxylase biotin carboxylase subunit n=1 Tax=Amycolatopsis sp. TaxID=37632 RepID=UPI002B49621B|nr:acetyl-CoA carboxylase biotin carboxylase subunit [Amycolatopsis sp.]HKS49983.1 acetyl-CoA carboxylase biotin carboxylase subunit [Amycolatopsis sp.]
MIRRLLIANRGEIALRVARTCRELGIEVVAVHSTADGDAPVLALADEAVCIGPPAAKESYLNIPNIVEAARQAGADAVHPGYGFLSEDPDFAEVCTANGLVFVGPDPEVMARLGNKAVVRGLMASAGLPLLPGTEDPVETVEDGERIAAEIGYPVIIKAAAGGGGRGMTVVPAASEFRAAYHATRASAHAVFRDSTVYLEKFLTGARHVEIQVLCDRHGNGIHLGERDCSVQRRHQKLVEEAPSTRLDAALRAEMGAAAVRGALSVGYSGAGTMEFLVDDGGRFYFMELNARIQVEHPVTEMVTGVDLVAEQIRVAGGAPLSLSQSEVEISGAAIECRINAEDPGLSFAPTPGVLERLDLPGGPWTRVDAGYLPGSRVSPYYDSLLAKVVVWGPDRPAALARMDRALTEIRVHGRGISTTAGFHRAVLRHPVFAAGEHTIHFVDEMLAGEMGTGGDPAQRHAGAGRQAADTMELLVDDATAVTA